MAPAAASDRLYRKVSGRTEVRPENVDDKKKHEKKGAQGVRRRRHRCDSLAVAAFLLSQRLTAEMAKGSEDAPRPKDAKKKKKKNSREEEATPQGERSSKSRKASSDTKRKSSRKGDIAAAAAPGPPAEVDLIGWGAGEAGPGLAAAAPEVPPVAPAPAGAAMRAPPPASMGTWESDLSAILSADAPPVAAAPVTGVWGGGGGGGGAAAAAGGGATNKQLLEELGGVVGGARDGRRRSGERRKWVD